MTTLLEDVAADQEMLDNEVRGLVTRMIREARASMQLHEHYHPTAGAIVGSRYYIWNLHWSNAWEREQVLEDVRQQLTEENATSSVLAYQSPDDDKVLMAIETPSWRELLILPYERTLVGVKFAEPRTVKNFRSPLSATVCLN